LIKTLYRFLVGTLRGRLILGVAVVHAVMMAVFVTDLTERQHAMLLERQVEEASALSQALATSAAGWIAADDVSGLQELVEAQRRYPEMLFAMLTDREGRVMADTDKSRRGQYLRDLPGAARQTALSGIPSLVDIATPAMIGGHHVGWARVGIGQKAASEKLAEITRSGIAYALAAIVIGSVIAWFMGRGITRRLYAVLETIAAVRSGNRLARSRIAGSDEPAVMAREFNAMLDALAGRDADLRASEERYRSLIRRVRTAIVLHDGDGRLLDSNPLAQELLGLSADQLLGKALVDPEWHFLREDGSVAPVAEYPVSLMLSTRKPLRDRVMGIKRPGRDDVAWVLVNAEPEWDAAGEPARVIVSFVDISERRRMEQELERVATFPMLNPQPIMEVDLAGRVSFVNPAARRIFPDLEQRGRDHPWLADWELLVSTCRDKRTKPDDREVTVGGRWYHQTMHYLPDDRRLRIYGFDITERKQSEEAQHRFNRELRAVSNCNQAMMRAEDEQSLLNDICRIICDEAGYRLAWVGYAEHDDAKTVRPAAWAGFDSGYIEHAKLSWAEESEHGRGPAGKVIRSGEPIYVQDFTTDPQMAPWRESALQHGYRSGVALPLKDDSAKVFGVLLIYSAEANAITPAEIRLLDELSGDLAFGITVLRSRAERERADDALRRLNRELRAISNCNQVLVRAEDEQTLLEDICRIVCDEAGYRMAWVGYPENDDAKTIRPVAWAGVEDGYLAQARITWADTERGRGPSGTAMRSGMSACFQDFSTDPLAAPWRESALQRGYRSSISMPLKDDNANTFGILTIFSTEPHAFTAEEVRLLGELAGDLAFGIMVLRERIERKRSVEALSESEQRFRLVFENSPVSIWEEDFSGVKTLFGGLKNEGVTDIETYFAEHPDTIRQCADLVKIVEVNRAALALHAATNREELLAGLVNTFTPESFDTFRQELVCLWNGGTEMTRDAVVRTLAGDPRNVSVYLSVCPGYEGTLARVLVSLIDITERKKLEEQRLAHLRFVESLDRVNRAIQGANDLEQMMSDFLDAVPTIFDCDRAFLIYPCDPEAASWSVPMERTKPEYPGANVRGLELPMDPESQRVFRTTRAVDGPAPFGPGSEYPLPEWLRQQFGVQSQLTMAIYPKVDKPYMFGLHQCSRQRVWTTDEEKLFQEIGRRLADGLTSLLSRRDLQASEDRYRRITEGLTDYQYSVRIDNGRPVETTQSPSCAAITGYTAQEFAADPNLWIQMVVPEDRDMVRERVQQILAGKEIPPIEHRIFREDGALRWVSDTTFLLKDASGKLLSYHGVIKDVTERKRAEDEIRKLNAELEQRVAERTQALEVANRELEAFSYSVSHDLRAPLRAIKGFSQVLLQDSAEKLDEQAQGLLRRVNAGVEKMAQLIDDLLQLSKISRQEMRIEPVDLSALAREAVEELEAVKSAHVTTWTIAPEAAVSGDPGLLRVALYNLLDNARKYSSKREVAHVEFGLTEKDGRPVYFVRDNGAGFDMAYAGKLFGAFQRLHTPAEFPGSGIGLATVARIVHRHGGEIWAESKLNEGASFFFTL